MICLSLTSLDPVHLRSPGCFVDRISLVLQLTVTGILVLFFPLVEKKRALLVAANHGSTSRSRSFSARTLACAETCQDPKRKNRTGRPTGVGVLEGLMDEQDRRFGAPRTA